MVLPAGAPIVAVGFHEGAVTARLKVPRYCSAFGLKFGVPIAKTRLINSCRVRKVWSVNPPAGVPLTFMKPFALDAISFL